MRWRILVGVVAIAAAAGAVAFFVLRGNGSTPVGMGVRRPRQPVPAHRSLPNRAVVVVARRGPYLTVELDLSAGRSLPAWEVVSTSVTGGAHPGTERERMWHSPTLGLDLRFSIARRIGGTFPYRLEVTARLLGVRPLR